MDGATITADTPLERSNNVYGYLGYVEEKIETVLLSVNATDEKNWSKKSSEFYTIRSDNSRM